jgi:hypothetical protein
VHRERLRSMLVNAALTAGFLLLVLGTLWLSKSFVRGYEKSFLEQDEYFTPRMKAADQQLGALAERLNAEYTAGMVEWRTFATPGTLATTVDIGPSPCWGFGPVVRKVVDAHTIDVTYGVEPLIPDEKFRAFWYVLVPRVTITVPSSTRSVRRFQVNWTADEERQGGVRRILDNPFSLLAPKRPPVPPMPPDLERAHALLTMNAAIISRAKNSVEVTGRPLPPAPNDTGDFGQGDFNIESMVKMVEQTLAFVRLLEKA